MLQNLKFQRNKWTSGSTQPLKRTGELHNYLTGTTKEVNKPDNDKEWVDITRRETMEGAEAAINGSVEHFEKKLEYVKGPKVVKTFK